MNLEQIRRCYWPGVSVPSDPGHCAAARAGVRAGLLPATLTAQRGQQPFQEDGMDFLWRLMLKIGCQGVDMQGVQPNTLAQDHAHALGWMAGLISELYKLDMVKVGALAWVVLVLAHGYFTWVHG